MTTELIKRPVDGETLSYEREAAQKLEDYPGTDFKLSVSFAGWEVHGKRGDLNMIRRIPWAEVETCVINPIVEEMNRIHEWLKAKESQ